MHIILLTQTTQNIRRVIQFYTECECILIQISHIHTQRLLFLCLFIFLLFDGSGKEKLYFGSSVTFLYVISSIALQAKLKETFCFQSLYIAVTVTQSHVLQMYSIEAQQNSTLKVVQRKENLGNKWDLEQTSAGQTILYS